MLRVTGLADLPKDLGPTVVTMGNFDGVHRGHQALLREVVQTARAEHATPVAVTFDPHPLAVLHPERAPQALCSLSTRLERIEALGIELTLVLPFTRELAAMTPEEFVREVFVDALHARVLVTGKDTRFGVRNSGDVDTLRELGTTYGFTVTVMDDVGDDHRFASSQVRARLVDGEVDAAATELGRPAEVRGMVVRGHQRGRELLGFPTANLAADSTGLIPADGVYAGWLTQDDLPADHPEHRMPAAISVGTNPTFDDVPVRTVEAYVLDRDDLDLYDKHVTIGFGHRLRGNTKFESIEELVAQMRRDVDACRDLLRGT